MVTHAVVGAGMNGTVAYCSQIPWIMAGSVRENITFGQPFNEELYTRVISSCALGVDLEQFPDGDNTEIGERGINISGTSFFVFHEELFECSLA